MSILRRMTVAAVVLSGLLLGGAVPLNADHHHADHRCKQRIHEAEYRLRRAIRRHGADSAQAESRRHRLEELREVCHYRHEQREDERREERREEHLEHEEHEMHDHD